MRVEAVIRQLLYCTIKLRQQTRRLCCLQEAAEQELRAQFLRRTGQVCLRDGGVQVSALSLWLGMYSPIPT